MYPKNSAAPPIITVGSIYLIADGTIQTSGASVRVKIGAGAWGAGGGTLAYDTTGGGITYTPTQAETNDEEFSVTVYKASCTSASVTVITTASAVAGRVDVDSIKGDDSIATDGSGYIVADVYAWNTTAVDCTNGLPDVNAKQISDTTAGADNAEAISADWINGGRLDLLLDAIPTTAMRGTDNAATAAALATLDAIVDRVAVICVGNVTGAGTGTEVFTYAGTTATVTVDASGNRTLAWS